MEKWLFFRAAMAGLGKYCMGGYGRIGVYRGSQPFVLGLTSPPPHTHRYTCTLVLLDSCLPVFSFGLLYGFSPCLLLRFCARDIYEVTIFKLSIYWVT